MERIQNQHTNVEPITLKLYEPALFQNIFGTF